ncbi:MAG TPA: flagellar hook-length control protein FliK [Candidatus Hydrogenedentes bacterium]|nr:flagellar hook-length control protein FliK [Candidatus Hydrogenedentota bacterium]
MADPGGVQPFMIPVTAPQGLPAGLRVGQVFQAVLQGQPGSLSIVVGGSRMLVGDQPHLQPGQIVNGEVLRVSAGLQIRLTPQSAPAPGEPGVAPSLSQVVASVLDSFPALTAPENAVRALHPSVPMTEAAVRSVLSLFLSDARMGADLQALANAMNEAAQAGALPQQMADSFALLSSALVSTGGPELHAILQAGRRAGRTIEGRLARAMESGRLAGILAETDGDLRALLMRVRQEEPFIRYLRSEGRLRGFQDTATRVLDRLTGAALQNLRGLEVPYVYLEIPTLEHAGLQRLQMHFVGEGPGKGRRLDPRNCTVALDLSLSRLGDLWLVLKVLEGRCTCLIRAADAEALEALRAEEEELVGALAAAGFEAARVRFEPWSGDRLREVGELIRQRTRMDLRA